MVLNFDLRVVTLGVMIVLIIIIVMRIAAVVA